jgi:hypothetical protein
MELYSIPLESIRIAMLEKSKNEQVEKYLEEIMLINDEQFNVLQKLREIVFNVNPKTNERIMYGGIMFSLNDDFGGIFVRKNHISFEFGNGFTMNDPDKFLEGKGKFRRHLKIRSLSDIDDKKVEFFVKQSM